LKTYHADERFSYHAKIGGSNSIDVSYDDGFFWDPHTGAERVRRAMYYNGVLWKGKKMPELPIPQPEKVFALPLDINLNKDYTYEYRRREGVGEYDGYVLDFKPLNASRNLYQGRAWIESRTFALVRTTTVQNRLSPPILSNEETQTFQPQVGPDG